MQNYLSHYLKKGVRFDGRKIDELREIKVETGVSATAEGSALVTWGNSQVIAGVKLNIEKPFPDTPDKGILMVNAELLPLSSPDFEGGPPDSTSIELARVVDRGIRESKAMDVNSLCIEPGEKVWSIAVDICTINHDGNLIDAAALAAVSALRDARFPTYKDGAIDYKHLTDKKLPLTKAPLAVTVHKIDANLIVDTTKEEEASSQARLTVTVTEDGNLCALQKGGEFGISFEEIRQMTTIGIAKAAEIRKLVK